MVKIIDYSYDTMTVYYLYTLFCNISNYNSKDINYNPYPQYKNIYEYIISNINSNYIYNSINIDYHCMLFYLYIILNKNSNSKLTKKAHKDYVYYIYSYLNKYIIIDKLLEKLFNIKLIDNDKYNNIIYNKIKDIISYIIPNIYYYY